jgi:2-dehydropantoate 2-reductase
MRIAIMGCGAMGSVYAGLLAEAGNEVLAINRWREHVDAITRNGLRVEGASGDRTVRLRAYTEPPTEPVDMLIIAVKATQAGVAAAALHGMIGPRTVIVTIQNGLGSADDVAAELGAGRLIVGIAGGFGASLKGPGHAHHNGMNVIRLGAYDDLAFDEVERCVAVWREAGFTAEAACDIRAMQWDKLICNVAYSGPCALTGLTVGEAMDDPEIGPLSRAAATEAWDVARALGIALDIVDPVAHVRAFAARIPDAKPSLLLDLEAGRPCEIDYINGAVAREAAKVGRDAPVNTTLTRLVRFRQARLSATC